MKPVNLQSLFLALVGWIFDFQNDNRRLPESLEDLIKNKFAERDYDPAKVLRRNREQGYIINYSLFDENNFELKISKDSISLIYKHSSKTLYYYQDNVLEYEQVLS
jgi:hypothetical protein